MEIKEALSQFGLNDREIKVYLCLLSNPGLTAYNLSQKTGIIRQTAYEIIDSLISKGIVSHAVKSGVKYFEAANPSKFKRILEEKSKIMDSVLPMLEKMQNTNLAKPKVEMYEGVEGLKSIYADIIKTKPSELLEYGNAENFSNVLKLYFIENYIAKRVDSRIKVRVIIEKDKKTEDISKSNKKLLRESRYLQDLSQIKTLNYVYNNKVAIVTFSEEPIGLIIENKDVASAQKVLFEILWRNAKNY